MEIKKDILWRVYISFIAISAICIAIFSKAVYIQQAEGEYWRSMSDSLHTKVEEISAERGTIFSEDGEMFSTSVPQFDIYIDFAADGLRENNGKDFYDNLDSLSYCLADLFKDRSHTQYKLVLKNGYRSKKRYYALKKR